jgi:hypothetical protein
MTIRQRQRVMVGVEKDGTHAIDVNESVCRTSARITCLLTMNATQRPKMHA